jgi:uncharacterized delta-60 repeat protein
MKFFYSLFFLLTISVNAQVTQQWAARYNGIGDYADKVNCMVRDANGNIYLAGYSTRAGNQKDFLVLKLNSNGDTLWERTFDGSNHGHDEALAIAYDANGFIFATGYLAGKNSGNDLFLVKMNLLGDSLWTKTYNYSSNQNDEGNSVAVDNVGNVVVTGQSDNDPTATSNDDYITLRFTPAGTQVFAVRYNGIGNGTDRASSVVFQTNGNTAVTGRSFGSFLDDDFMTISYTPTGTVAWSAPMDAGNGNDRAIKIIQDPTGNLYVAGQSNNGQDYDYAIEVYDASGLFLWEAFYDHIPGNDYPTGIALDNLGNVLITGRCDSDPTILVSNDMVTLSYTSTGILSWVSTFIGTGLGNDEGADVTTDLLGNVFVTGRTDINPSAAITDYDIETIKYSSAGTQLWSQTSGPTNSLSDGGVSILADASGNCIVAGNVQNVSTLKDIRAINYSSAGATQWLKEYSGTGDNSDVVNAMTTDASGNSYMAGYTYSSNNKRDMCVAKINSIGDTVWVRTMNGTLNSDDEATAVVVDALGNVFMTGYTKDTITGSDYCTAKYNSAGTLLWFLKYNFATANGNDRAIAMAITSNGDVIVTGQSDSDPTTNTNYDIETVKYSSTGFLQWTQRFNGAGNLNDVPNAISVSLTNEPVIVGKTAHTLLDDNALVIKINSTGTLLWSHENLSTIGNDDAVAVSQDWSGDIGIAVKIAADTITDDMGVWFINSMGIESWLHTFNGSGNGNDRPADIAIDQSGNSFLIGETDVDTSSSSSNYDMVTIKYDLNGQQQWVKTYAGLAGDDDYGIAVAIDNATGYAYVTGQCNNGSILLKNNDIVTLQYDPSGQQLLIGTYNAFGKSDVPTDLAIRGNNIYVSGSSVGTGNNQKDMVMLLYSGFNVGISSNEIENTISVFPNPCSDFTEVHFTNSAQHRMISIMDMNGRIVLNQEANSELSRIETSELSPGIYLGTIISDGNSKQQFKIVVQ